MMVRPILLTSLKNNLTKPHGVILQCGEEVEECRARRAEGE